MDRICKQNKNRTRKRVKVKIRKVYDVKMRNGKKEEGRGKRV